MRRFVFGVLLFVFVLASSIQAAAPKKVEQNVYRLNLFDGKAFTSTLAPKPIERLYMLADTQNVFYPAKTKVYWWDITSEWMADWEGLNKPIEGILEITQGGKVIKQIKRQAYTFKYSATLTGGATLLLGDQAHAEFAAFQELVANYYEQYMQYLEAEEEYQKALEAYQSKPEGKKPPTRPKQPATPNYYVVEPQEGYILNLPKGEYQVQVRDKKGKLIADTRKDLSVFTPQRQAIAYTIRSETKWTLPQDSLDPDREVYLAREQVLYLTPFHQSQFNAYLYAKLSELAKPASGRGGEYIYNWQRFGEVAPGYTLELVRAGRVVTRAELKPYRVQQLPGAALGYEILPTEIGQEHFMAYRIAIKGPGTYFLRLVDSQGKVVPGSTRTIQSLKTIRTWPIFALVLLPLLILLLRRIYRRGPQTSEGLE